MISRIAICLAAAAALTLAAPSYSQQARPKAPAPSTTIYAKPAPETAAPTQAQLQAQAQALMDPIAESRLKDVSRAVANGVPGSVAVKTLRGRLAVGATQLVPIEADKGTYYVAGVCDEACTNLDLRMLDGAGALVYADDGPDGFPLTQASVSGPAKFQVEIVMKACTKDPCAYAVGIFRQ